MAPARARTWVDGLDNLGENLIRLATSVRTIEDTPAALASDAAFAVSMGQMVSGFETAFRQAVPVLVGDEKSFLRLIPMGMASGAGSGDDSASPRQAQTLVHEGILGCQEIASLLGRVAGAAEADPAVTRQILQAALRQLSDSTAATGWDLRAVCHEYQSEVRLSGSVPMVLADLGPGAHSLMNDMARAATKMRGARREWYRLNQRLAAAIGLGPTLPPPGRGSRA